MVALVQGQSVGESKLMRTPPRRAPCLAQLRPGRWRISTGKQSRGLSVSYDEVIFRMNFLSRTPVRLINPNLTDFPVPLPLILRRMEERFVNKLLAPLGVRISLRNDVSEPDARFPCGFNTQNLSSSARPTPSLSFHRAPHAISKSSCLKRREKRGKLDPGGGGGGGGEQRNAIERKKEKEKKGIIRTQRFQWVRLAWQGGEHTRGLALAKIRAP